MGGGGLEGVCLDSVAPRLPELDVDVDVDVEVEEGVEGVFTK